MGCATSKKLGARSASDVADDGPAPAKPPADDETPVDDPTSKPAAAEPSMDPKPTDVPVELKKGDSRKEEESSQGVRVHPSADENAAAPSSEPEPLKPEVIKVEEKAAPATAPVTAAPAPVTAAPAPVPDPPKEATAAAPKRSKRQERLARDRERVLRVETLQQPSSPSIGVTPLRG